MVMAPGGPRSPLVPDVPGVPGVPSRPTQKKKRYNPAAVKNLLLQEPYLVRLCRPVVLGSR